MKNKLMEHLRYMYRNKGRQLKPKTDIYLLKANNGLYSIYKKYYLNKLV